MKSLFLIATIALSAFCSNIGYSQEISIHPTPQSLNLYGDKITIPQNFMFVGLDKVHPVVKKGLIELLGNGVAKSDYKIVVGKNGDSSVKRYKSSIPDSPEGYYLSVDHGSIVLAGADDRGVYYALNTLSQLLSKGMLQKTEIIDFPDVRYRGVVEGFYGTPWSYEDRVRQLEFYGQNKLNTYIYGPKDDPYHSSPHWREAYPAEEAENIKELVSIAKQNMVDFIWAIHPGKDIKWNDEDRRALIGKFQAMYDLGVRSFALFFDDISGIGTDPVKQSELLNFLDNEFVAKRKDVTPLVICPTEYNKSWSDPAKGYLATLGDNLNPSIHIMWTGDRVVAEIKRQSLEWVNQYIKRPAYIWWNFPVSDYVRNRLLMGEVYGNDANVKGMMSGFLSNPMEHAEASKIAIYSVASYAWNLEKYDSRKSWEDGIKVVMPDSWRALRKFAQHNSDLGENTHRLRRRESEEIKPYADKFLESFKKGEIDIALREMMKKEFKDIKEASITLLGSDDNIPLREEIEPWLFQFGFLANSGEAVLSMLEAFEEGNIALFIRKFNALLSAKKSQFGVDRAYNPNQYQQGFATGTLVLQPFIDELGRELVDMFNNKYGYDLLYKSSYTPHRLRSNIEQIANVPLQGSVNIVALSPVLEIIKWSRGGYVTIELDKEYKAQRLELDMGDPALTKWLLVEYSKDGKAWEEIVIPNSDKNQIQIRLDNRSLAFIRLTNRGEDREIGLKRVALSL